VFCLVQLSDLHIGATWRDADPVSALQAAIASMDRLGLAPDAVLVSGDLVDHATDLEYEQVAGVLGQIAAPVHVLPVHTLRNGTVTSYIQSVV
jgi:Icc protein